MSTSIAPVENLSAAQLDTLCINTIRTLSIDAVQQANSGHPGTPMALAPLVYTIWNRVLRFDPQDPIWPNRDRFVLSNGHASMLLWSALHLTGASRECRLRDGWGSLRSRSTTSAASASSTARRPAIPNTTGCRGWRPRPARWAGGGDERGDGNRGEVALPPIQSAGLRDFRLQHLYGLRRRLPDGRHCVRSGVARRTSRARQPVLDLRQQPHHDRRQHANRVHRRRPDPIPRVWMERPANWRCQRHRSH